MKKMTYEMYHDVPYVGKHAKKWYNVHRVLGPGGPSETVQIYGLEEAKTAAEGIYGYKIATLDGRTVCEA